MGGFHFNPIKGIERALGIPDKVAGPLNTAIFPLLVTQTFTNLLEKGINAAGSINSPKPPNQSQLNVPGQTPYNFQFQGPSYQAPYYGGGGGAYDAYSYQPTYNPYQNPGGSQWGYSTASPIYSTPQYQAYSAPQDRSWETLAGLAEVALPFFL